MRGISILFILLGLSSPFTSTSHAQSREIGAQSLALDDGNGHIVDITIPLMTGPGPYSWVLPITPGGSSLSLPTPTTVGSMLYSNGTNAWLENTNVTATNLGVLSVAGAYQIGGNTVLSDAGTQNIFVGVGAGSANGAGSENTAIGYNASVGTGNVSSTALGWGAIASGNNATALGYTATANAGQAMAIGFNASASAVEATAIGTNASATFSNATALGWGALGTASNTTALGYIATASAANATAIGYNASASTANEIQLGNTSVTLVNTSGNINAGGTSGTTGVYQIGGSTLLSDAGTQNIFVGVLAGSANGSGTNNTALGYNASVGTGNSNATAVGWGTQASLYATAIGVGATASAGGATALGNGSSASAFGAMALGDGAVANASSATALGGATQASAANTTAIGIQAIASGGGATAVGGNTQANASDATAIGTGASALATNATSLGYTAAAYGSNSMALGPTAFANAANATAIGYNASVSTDNEIQLGNSSVTLVNTSGLVQTTGGANLSGTSSPLQVQGSAGTSGQVLTSAGPGLTPTWAPVSSYAGSTFFNGAGYTTGSNSQVMAGLSSGTTLITPTKSGKVLITIVGNFSFSSTGSGTFVIYYGSGNGPAAGAALTGFAVTNPAQIYSNGPATLTGLVTGLTVGTGYWIDAAISTCCAGTATIYNLTITAVELP